MRHRSGPIRPWLLAGLLGLVMAGCAQTGPTPVVAPDTSTRGVAAERALQVWGERLAEHVSVAGQGDVAVLAALPALRSPAQLRPAQIVFGVTDIDALEAGRDGFDAVGLMVGRQDDAARFAYVFVVGVIERQDHRPVDLIDVRAVTVSVRQGQATWVIGPEDARALALYERRRDADTALRFPALLDQFVLAACVSGRCVEERASGARWPLY